MLAKFAHHNMPGVTYPRKVSIAPTQETRTAGMKQVSLKAKRIREAQLSFLVILEFFLLVLVEIETALATMSAPAAVLRSMLLLSGGGVKLVCDRRNQLQTIRQCKEFAYFVLHDFFRQAGFCPEII